MPSKIYHIGKDDIASSTLLSFLDDKNCQVLGNYFHDENVITDIFDFIPDLIILDIPPYDEIICTELLEAVNSKLEVPFIIRTNNIDDLNTDKLLNFEVYGVFLESTSLKELYINIKTVITRFEKDRKNKQENYFLNEAERLSNVGHWRLHIKNQNLEWSDETYRIFEKDSTTFTVSYEHFLNAIHPEDRDQVGQAFSNSLHHKIPYEIEHRIVVNDKVKYVVEKCETFHNNDGPLLSVGTVQDITARKNLELELEKSKRNFKEVVRSTSEKGSLINPDHLVYLKTQYIAAKKLGYLGKEISNKEFYEVVNSQKTYTQLLKSVEKLNLGEGFKAEAELIKKWVENEFYQKQVQLEELNLTLYNRVQEKSEKLKVERNERKRVEELQKILLNVIEQSSDSIMIAKADGTIEYVNAAFSKVTLYKSAEVLGRKTSFLRSNMYSDSYYDQIWSTLQRGKVYSGEYTGQNKKGEVYSVTQEIFPIKNSEGKTTHFASVCRDSTNKKELDKKLLEVEEDERARISRELHDGIGQSLAAIKLSLNRIFKNVELPENDVSDILAMLQSLTNSIREVSFDLMPSILKDYGLSTAIYKLVEQIEQITDIRMCLTLLNNDIKFSKEIEISLYRIVQESLNNAVANSKANTIWVLLDYSNGKIILKIRDDGKGFDYNGNKRKFDGQGIRNMKHRTSLMNGVFHLDSNDRGTEIIVKVPYK